LTGSESDFRKRPDPSPDLNKFSTKFLLNLWLYGIYGFYTHQKSLYTVESFIIARIRIRMIRSQTSGFSSGSDQKVPDPAGSATQPTIISLQISCKILTNAHTLKICSTVYKHNNLKKSRVDCTFNQVCPQVPVYRKIARQLDIPTLKGNMENIEKIEN
jgi:hypothetical protein